MVDIKAVVRAAIDTTKDESAKPRLRRCLPALLSAVGHGDGSAAGEFVMEAATPKAAFMFCADEWPDVDESAFQTHEVARALKLERFFLIVGDEDRRMSGFPVDLDQPAAQLLSHLRV